MCCRSIFKQSNAMLSRQVETEKKESTQCLNKSELESRGGLVMVKYVLKTAQGCAHISLQLTS